MDCIELLSSMVVSESIRFFHVLQDINQPLGKDRKVIIRRVCRDCNAQQVDLARLSSSSYIAYVI